MYQDLINGHAAGKSNYDVVNLRGYEIFPNAANSGTILDVSSYYDFAGDPTWQESSVKDLGVFKGKRYGIPYSPNEVGNGIWYNRGAAAQIQRARPVDLCGEGHLELADLPRRLQKADPGHQRRRQARLLGLHLQRSVAGIRIFQQRLPDLLRRQRHAQNFPGFQERPGRHSIYCRPAHDRQYGAGRQRAGAPSPTSLSMPCLPARWPCIRITPATAR